MNWKSIIAELAEHGLTQLQIAAACDCGQSTISDLATGKAANPGFMTGMALLKLRDETLAKVRRKSKQRKETA